MNRRLARAFFRKLEDLYIAAAGGRVLLNPIRVGTARLLGGRERIRFLNGFTYPQRPCKMDRIWSLVDLAVRHGVTFAPASPEPLRPGIWTLADDGVLTTDTGVRFDLPSVDPTVLAETFVYDVHFIGFDLRGTTVLDIGANVGDTALYYASKGAKVVALNRTHQTSKR